MTEVVKIYLKKDMMNYVVMLLDTIDIVFNTISIKL